MSRDGKQETPGVLQTPAAACRTASSTWQGHGFEEKSKPWKPHKFNQKSAGWTHSNPKSIQLRRWNNFDPSILVPVGIWQLVTPKNSRPHQAPDGSGNGRWPWIADGYWWLMMVKFGVSPMAGCLLSIARCAHLAQFAYSEMQTATNRPPFGGIKLSKKGVSCPWAGTDGPPKLLCTKSKFWTMYSRFTANV